MGGGSGCRESFLIEWEAMHNQYPSFNSKSNSNFDSEPRRGRGADRKRNTIRTSAKRELANPVDYEHRHESMARYAKLLALRYDGNRTRHAYYRQLRLLMEHFDRDPALLDQEAVRDYLLFLKLEKKWKPQSMRQAVACLRLFFMSCSVSRRSGKCSPRSARATMTRCRRCSPGMKSTPC